MCRTMAVHVRYYKHLITSLKGNSEFCFLETVNVPNIEVSRSFFEPQKMHATWRKGT